MSCSQWLYFILTFITKNKLCCCTQHGVSNLIEQRPYWNINWNSHTTETLIHLKEKTGFEVQSQGWCCPIYCTVSCFQMSWRCSYFRKAFLREIFLCYGIKPGKKAHYVFFSCCSPVSDRVSSASKWLTWKWLHTTSSLLLIKKGNKQLSLVYLVKTPQKKLRRVKQLNLFIFFSLGYINRSDLKSEKDNLTCYTAKRDILIW